MLVARPSARLASLCGANQQQEQELNWEETRETGQQFAGTTVSMQCSSSSLVLLPFLLLAPLVASRPALFTITRVTASDRSGKDYVDDGVDDDVDWSIVKRGVRLDQ